MKFFRQNHKDLYGIEQKLLSLKKPRLSSATKQEMKGRVLKSARRMEEIRLAAKAVTVSAWERKSMREGVVSYAESSLRWRGWRAGDGGGIFGFVNSFRSGVAAFVLFVFCAATFVVMPFKAPVTYARDTVLGVVQGDVLVLKKSGAFKGRANMKLEEGDSVLTKQGSSATILFLDESLSRLGENTSLTVTRLYGKPLDSAVTDVRLFLEEGRLWTRVVNLADTRSRFVVSTSTVQAEVEKKAAFDMASSHESTAIAVFDNVVKISGSSTDFGGKGAWITSRTVVAGYSAEIGAARRDVKIERLPKHEIALREKSLWAAVNLESDEEYRKSLEKEKEEMIQEGLWAQGGVALTNEEAEGLRVRALDAFGVLVKAEANLVRGVREEALAGLNEFELSIRTVLLELDELKKREPVFAGLVRSTIDEKLQVQLKDFAGFRPGHRLYRVKELLRYTELLLAESSLEKAAVLVAQAGDMLTEIEDIVGSGSSAILGSLLDKYQERSNAFVALIQQEDAGVFSELIDLQAEHMKILTAIEQSLVHLDQKQMRDRVRAVRKDTLVKFIAALEQTSYRVNPTALYELKDLYATYGENATGEEALLSPAVDKFLIDVTEGGGSIDFDPEGLNEIPATPDTKEAGWLGESYI